MRKFAKRLTAMILSLAMVAACALQAGAEDTAVTSLKLKSEDTNISFTDENGIVFAGDLTDVYKGTFESVTVTSERDVTLTPKNGSGIFYFGVQHAEGEEVGFSVINPPEDETATANINKRITVDKTRSDASCTYYKVAYLTTLKAAGATLELSFSEDATPKVTLLRDGSGFTVRDIKDVTAEGEDGTYTYGFTVWVYQDSVEQGYVPKVTVQGKKENNLPQSTDHEPGQKNGKDYEFTISGITTDTEIQVGIEKQSFTITFNKDTGKDSFETTAMNQTVAYGSSYTFVVTPKEGYKADDVHVDFKEFTNQDNKVTLTNSGTTYTIGNIIRSVVIDITGPEEKEQKKISFSAPKGVTFKKGSGDGNVDLSNTTVEYGTNYEFQVELDPSCSLSLENMVVSANGIQLFSTEKGSTENSRKYSVKITEDTIISVSGVAKNTYKVTMVDGAWYTFTTNNLLTVEHGGTFTFKVQIDNPAYESEFYKNPFGKVIVVGSCSYDKNSYNSSTKTFTINDVTGDILIGMLDVAPATYSVTAPDAEAGGYEIADEGGSSKTNIQYGGTYTFTVTPTAGYRIDSVTYTMGDGGPKAALHLSTGAGGAAKYTITGITSDVTITVTVAKVRMRITFVDPKSATGSVTKEYQIDTNVESDDYIQANADGVLTLKSNPAKISHPHYTFEGWLRDGAPVAGGKLNFTTEDQDITLTAQFKLNIKDLLNLELKRAEFLPDGVEGELYRLWLIAAWATQSSVKMDLGVDVRIANCGFLYSDTEIDYNEDQLSKLLTRKDEGDLKDKWSDQQLRKVRDRLYIYNLSPNSDRVDRSVFEMAEGQFSWNVGGIKAESTRYVKAYVDVVVEGVHYCVISDYIESGGDGLTPNGGER